MKQETVLDYFRCKAVVFQATFINCSINCLIHFHFIYGFNVTSWYTCLMLQIVAFMNVLINGILKMYIYFIFHFV